MGTWKSLLETGFGMLGYVGKPACALFYAPWPGLGWQPSHLMEDVPSSQDLTDTSFLLPAPEWMRTRVLLENAGL